MQDNLLRNQLLQYRTSLSPAVQAARTYGDMHLRAAERLGRTIDLSLAWELESDARRARTDWETVASETGVHSDIYTILLSAQVRSDQVGQVRGQAVEILETLRGHLE